jgi:uncharacterized protein (TIGR02466 family)
MIRYDLFPTPVFKYENFLTEDECSQVVSSLDDTYFYKYAALTGEAKTSFTNVEVHFSEIAKCDNNIIEKITQQFDLAIFEYCHTTGYAPSKLSNVWFSKQYKGSRLIRHSHGGSVLSGVLYLKVDENSSDIFFYSPNPFTHYSTVTKNTEYTEPKVRFKPKVGDVLVFPSWLEHGSDESINNSDERVILSFNTVYA